MSPTEIAYIAGLVDGEGCLHLRIPPQSSFAVEIAQKKQDVLFWVQKIFGAGRVRRSRKGPFEISRWYITRREEILTFLEAILPYLIVKKRQAQLLRFATKLSLSSCHGKGRQHKLRPLQRKAFEVLAREISKEKHNG